MKLASYKQGRDGRLMVVSRDLSKCVVAHKANTEIPDRLQPSLENWSGVKSKLEKIANFLEGANVGDGVGSATVEAFDPVKCESPLPRSYQIADGSAYLNHVELVRKARGAEMPPEFLHDPLMYQAVSDTIMGPMDPIPAESEKFGIDFEAEVAVIVDDTPMAVTPEEALSHIQLIMLMNDVTHRALIPAELGKGFGFFNGKPPSAFTPVAVTPDELGDAWKGGKLNLPLLSTYNGVEFGRPNAGEDMQFGFGELVAHAAKTRPLGAGTIVGSGTISNSDRSVGSSCLAEVRMIEKIEEGEFKTPFMKFGDTIRIEMLDAQGESIFGAIEQEVVQYNAAKKAA